MESPLIKKSRFYTSSYSHPSARLRLLSWIEGPSTSRQGKDHLPQLEEANGHSACVDKALKQAMPNDPRWDYAIGYQRDRTE